MQPNVPRHARDRMTAAGHTCVVSTDLCVVRLFADDRLGVMRPTLRGERAHDGKLIIQSGQFFKRTAKRMTSEKDVHGCFHMSSQLQSDARIVAKARERRLGSIASTAAVRASDVAPESTVSLG